MPSTHAPTSVGAAGQDVEGIVIRNSRNRKKRISSRNQNKRGSQKARVEAQRRLRDGIRFLRRKARESWLRREPNAVELASGDTAAERLDERRRAFADRFGPMGVPLHGAAWWLHNCVAHPLLGLLPGLATVWLHDRTSDWLNLRLRPSRSPLPMVRRRWAWIVHNCVSHPLIGVAPIGSLLDWHERTAEDMDEDDWV